MNDREEGGVRRRREIRKGNIGKEKNGRGNRE